MRALLLVVVTVVSVNAVSSLEAVDEAWLNFKSDHAKQYRSLYEETVRRKIFTDNFNKITEHNKLYEQGLVTYSLKINQYADRTQEDIKNTLNGLRWRSKVPDIVVKYFKPDPKVPIPDEFDWRRHGAVTPVKDQGQCGSCWAFSTTGTLEGQYFLKTGRLIPLSEQNLMDCSYIYHNYACDGGDITSALAYVHDNDGLDSEDSYPYHEKTRHRCRYNPSKNVTSTRGYVNIREGNEEHLKAAIATVGPIAVGIDASSENFNLYGGGIYYAKHCLNDPEDLDHAVLAVGYGTDKHGADYWLIKNSWGTFWGEDGYIKMARNRMNNCGVASTASFPLNY